MAGQRPARVMIVDDDPDISLVAGLALEAAGGFIVKACGSGREAVREAPSWTPDVIVLDAVMPGMDGPATFDAFRRMPATSSVPVVFMTARSRPVDVGGYVGMGAAGVIAKPFDPADLPGAVRKILEGCR